MLRIAIPYGLMSSHQLRTLAEIARDYDKGYGHFTTRTNLQLNWVKLEEVPDILAKLAANQMHTIQTSGNCIRNTTTDPYAGIHAEEIADPRPYCEIIRQWSTFHPEFAFCHANLKLPSSAQELTVLPHRCMTSVYIWWSVTAKSVLRSLLAVAWVAHRLSGS